MKKALSLFLATLLVLSTMSCLSVVSFAADELTEIEVNDTYTDAQDIEIGAVNVGTLSDENDIDWYKFTSDKDYFVVDFAIQDPTQKTSCHWDVTIYNSDLDILQKFENKRNEISVNIPVTGDIYIKVVSAYKDIDATNKNYEIKVTTFADALWENEKNDTSANATEMTIGETYTGSLFKKDSIEWVNDNVDWYKFTADKDYFVVDFAIQDPTQETSCHWDVTIYNSKLEILQKFENKRNEISVNIPVTGDIYVKVVPAYNDDDVNNKYYEIKVTTFADALWENEKNDTSANATEMTIGKTYTGSLFKTDSIEWVNDNVDWYKFTADKDYFVVDFAIQDPTQETTNHWDVTIYNSKLEILQKFENKRNEISINIPVKGDIYVKVVPAYNDDEVNNKYYNITATTVENGNWETENNDTSTTANAIKQGVVYMGNLSTSGNDVDFYKFTSTSDAFKLKFSVNLGDDNVDNIKDGWKITVYPADSGSSILEYYLKCNSAKESIVLPYQKGKVYYVKIEAANKNEAPIGELYKFAVVDAAGSNKWEVENGKTDLPSATTITNGTKIFGNFFNGDDIDYYKLAIPASGKITVKFNRTESELAYDGWKLLIQDAVGSVIDEVNLGNSLNATVTSKTLPKQGNYYVRIQPNNSDDAPSSNINYNLTVKYTMTAPAITSISNAAKGVSLKWSAVKDCSGYQIYRAVSGGSYAKLATIVGDSKVTYTDTTAANAKTYAYKIIAVDGSYKSAFSTAKAITFLKATTAKAVANTSAGVAFSWTAVPGAKGYEIYRAAGSGSYQKIVTVKSGTVVKYVDKTAKSGTTYKYKVRAYVDSVSKGAFSAEKAIVFVAAPVAKAAASSKTGITYTWTPVTGVTGYQVYRATGSGSFTKIATVKGATAAKYVDKTAKKGVTYKYKVRAYKGSTAGAFSTKVISIKDKY